MSNPSKPTSRPYFSNGQALQSPPFSVRVNRFFDSLYMFFGLYVVSLFSFDPYVAAEASTFNINNQSNSQSQRPRWGTGGGSDTRKGPGGGGGGGGGGSGGKGPWGGGGGSGGGKKLGTIDDVRGPECGSCG